MLVASLCVLATVAEIFVPSSREYSVLARPTILASKVSQAGTFSSGVATFNGGASYSYAGLGNPILSLSGSQWFDAQSRPSFGPMRLPFLKRMR